MDLHSLLKDLVETPSVSGFEKSVREKISSIMEEYGLKVETDVMGNLIGSIGEGSLKVMLAAHMDTLGLMVTFVDEKGYIKFSGRGYDPRVLYGQQVILHTDNGPVYGVIAAKAAHLLKPEERDKGVKIENMVIDIGAEKKEDVEKLGIKPGTVITPVLYLRKLLNNKVLGIGLDDKTGVTSMLKVLDYISPEELNVKLYLVATVQEEMGLRGAITAAYNIKPDIGIAIDVTHAIQPGVEPAKVRGISLGKGPAIGIGPNFHPRIWEKLIETAEKNKIPYQPEPLMGPSGTDAWVIQVSRGGVATGLVSIPLKYMHSLGEVASLNDIDNTAKLLAYFIKDLSKNILKI